MPAKNGCDKTTVSPRKQEKGHSAITQDALRIASQFDPSQKPTVTYCGGFSSRFGFSSGCFFSSGFCTAGCERCCGCGAGRVSTGGEVRWGCARSLGGEFCGRGAGSFRLGSGRLFVCAIGRRGVSGGVLGCTVGGRFGSGRLGSGRLLGCIAGVRFASGGLFGCAGRAMLFSGCVAGVLAAG